MNVNSKNTAITNAITKAPAPIAPATYRPLLDCSKITNCSKACSTIARYGCAIGCCVASGTVFGMGLLSTSSAIAAKITPAALHLSCTEVAKHGALGGAIGGGIVGTLTPVVECACHQLLKEDDAVIVQPQRLNTPAIKAQPKTRKSTNKRANYHSIATYSIATSDRLPLLLEQSSEDEL